MYHVFLSEKHFSLKKNEILDLPKLQEECRKKGIVAAPGKGVLAVHLPNVTFNVHSKGSIGRCYAGKYDDAINFDSTVPAFFWSNFVINCVKKRS